MQKHNKILAVDDNAMNLDIIEEALGDEYNLKTATTGEEALEIAADFQPHVVLLDIMMPGMDGYEVCRKMRASETLRYSKIVMVSAKATTADRLEGYGVGADDYLSKPFDEEELLAKVRVYLRLTFAEELDQMRRLFTATVTHEMRTPMTVIKGILSGTLENVYGDINPELHQQLEVADRHVDRLSNILNNFFDVSMIDAGQVKLELATFSIQSAVSEVVELLKPTADRKQIELNVELPAEEVLIYADQEKIRKILINVVSNAIKFIGDGDQINIRAKDFPDLICIDVEDSGAGIQNTDVNEIFNRFMQVARHAGPGEHGTGLGLAVTKELVELHGGHIGAENRPEGGAVFSIEIPLSAETETPMLVRTTSASDGAC